MDAPVQLVKHKPICPKCGKLGEYDHAYDAYACYDCDIWLERGCGSSNCEFCSSRPSKPSQVGKKK